jgi:hypothetical protein
LLRFRQRFPLLFFVHDRVASEHRICTMPGNLHGNGLGHSGLNHVARGCTAKIMEQSMAHICSRAGRCPRLAEVTDRLTFAMKHILREPLVAVLVLDSLRFAATFDDGQQLAF